MRLFNIILALLFCSVSVVFAEEKTVELPALEDTFVQSGDPDENNDGSTEFEVDGEDGGRNFALIRFDLGQIPSGAEVSSAVLQCYVSNSGSSDQFSTIYNMLVEWDALTATYNTVFGGVAEPIPGVHYADDPFSENFHSDAGQPFMADVTALVQEHVNGLPNYGYIFVPDMAQGNGFGLVASEAAVGSGPTLIITTPNGTFVFDEPQDSWINGEADSLEDNYGNDVIFDIDTGTAPPNVAEALIGLIRFDSIFDQIPPGTEIMSAHLSLTVVDSGTPIEIREIQPYQNPDFGIDTNFNEATVTFLNFIDNLSFPTPGMEITADANGDAISVATLSGDTGTFELDVTSTVTKWSSGELENYGFLLEPTGTGGVGIITKEAVQYAPKLIVMYDDGQTDVEEWTLY